MFVDTHCHIDVMVKKEFNVPMTADDIAHAQNIIDDSKRVRVNHIINVGTSVVESSNCIALAHAYPQAISAAIGIHPNDCSAAWKEDLKALRSLLRANLEHVVAIGECGLDFHYPDFNIQRQKDAFKAQIELALTHQKALIVHTRDAGDETLLVLQEYKNDISAGIIHCFSEDHAFAQTVIEWGFSLGIGGTVTYPKNNILRDIVQHTDLAHIVLETDAPFLPPQTMRGKQNSPAQIPTIAQFIATLKGVSLQTVAQHTTRTAARIFNRDFGSAQEDT
jgi:TatD DNase family protein